MAKPNEGGSGDGGADAPVVPDEKISPLFSTLFSVPDPEPGEVREKEEGEAKPEVVDVSETLASQNRRLSDFIDADDPEPKGDEKKPAGEEGKEGAAGKAEEKLVKFSIRKPAAPAPEKQEETPAPPEEKPVEPPVDPNAEFLETLFPAERDFYDRAKFAAENLGGEFKGMEAKAVKFFKAHQEHIEAATAKDPDVKFDDENEEYQEFLRKNPPPKLTKAQDRKIDAAMIRADVKKDLSAEYDKKLEEAQKEIRRLRTEPRAREALNGFYAEIDKALPPELAEAIQTKGLEAAQKEFGFEYGVAERVTEEYTSMGRAFIELTHDLGKFDPKDEAHARLEAFVQEQSKAIAASAHAKDQEGRTFIDRGSFVKLKPEEQGKHWTLTDRQVLRLIAAESKARIEREITTEERRRAEQGFVRTSPKPAASVRAKDAPPAPGARVTPMPSRGTGPEKERLHPAMRSLGYADD